MLLKHRKMAGAKLATADGLLVCDADGVVGTENKSIADALKKAGFVELEGKLRDQAKAKRTKTKAKAGKKKTSS